MPQLLPREDPDAAACVTEALLEDGIEVHYSVKILSVARPEAGSLVKAPFGKYAVTVVLSSGEERTFECESLLNATGRVPNVFGLGLEKAGVEWDTRCGVHIDDYFVTANPKVFSAGDCASPYKFTHAADWQARCAVRNMFLGAKASFATGVCAGLLLALLPFLAPSRPVANLRRACALVGSCYLSRAIQPPVANVATSDGATGETAQTNELTCAASPSHQAKHSDLLVPWCTYTDPEIAHVGLYEKELDAAGTAYDTYTRPLDAVDRCKCEGVTRGFVKISCVKGEDKILGATIVGPSAGDLISEATHLPPDTAPSARHPIGARTTRAAEGFTSPLSERTTESMRPPYDAITPPPLLSACFFAPRSPSACRTGSAAAESPA
jgi:pyruvate/2-oxoglutarate dehydrogenase complex dihydrolipoamide dehydrogenase (E3) component